MRNLTNLSVLGVLLVAGGLLAAPAHADFFFGGDFGALGFAGHNGFFEPYLFGRSGFGLDPSWHSGSDFGLGGPGFGGGFWFGSRRTPARTFGAAPWLWYGAGYGGYPRDAIRTGHATPYAAGLGRYLERRQADDAVAWEVVQGANEPVQFRARQVAPRVLEVEWPGSEEAVQEVLFELLGPGDRVVDQRREMRPPYRGPLNLTREVRKVRVTVAYASGVTRSVAVPFEPVAAD